MSERISENEYGATRHASSETPRRAAAPQPAQSVWRKVRASYAKRPAWFLFRLVVGVELCIGALLFFWLLRAMSPASPAGTAAASQSLMSPAAERYWRNLDLAQVQKDLGGWDRASLTKLFVTIQQQSSDPETRRHLNDLGKTLQLPGFDAPSSSATMPSLLSQPVFLLSILLSITPLLVAATLIFVPLAPAQPKVETPEIQNAESAAVLEALLPDVTLEQMPEEPAKKEEEKKEEPQEETAESEENPGFGDLASLFEEEDTSISTLEAFCKNLAEITVDDLHAKVKKLADDLRRPKTRRAR